MYSLYCHTHTVSSSVYHYSGLFQELCFETWKISYYQNHHKTLLERKMMHMLVHYSIFLVSSEFVCSSVSMQFINLKNLSILLYPRDISTFLSPVQKCWSILIVFLDHPDYHRSFCGLSCIFCYVCHELHSSTLFLDLSLPSTVHVCCNREDLN